MLTRVWGAQNQVQILTQESWAVPGAPAATPRAAEGKVAPRLRAVSRGRGSTRAASSLKVSRVGGSAIPEGL